MPSMSSRNTQAIGAASEAALRVEETSQGTELGLTTAAAPSDATAPAASPAAGPAAAPTSAPGAAPAKVMGPATPAKMSAALQALYLDRAKLSVVKVLGAGQVYCSSIFDLFASLLRVI